VLRRRRLQHGSLARLADDCLEMVFLARLASWERREGLFVDLGEDWRGPGRLGGFFIIVPISAARIGLILMVRDGRPPSTRREMENRQGNTVILLLSPQLRRLLQLDLPLFCVFVRILVPRRIDQTACACT
jgi:hypothetical protein